MRLDESKIGPLSQVTYDGILEGLHLYWCPGERHEVRHFRGEKAIYRWFEDAEAAAQYIYSQARQGHPADNFYLTINPVKPGVAIERATCDHHIAHRRRLVLDIDPDSELRKVDGQKVSATDEELEAVRRCALVVSSKVQSDFGWPEPSVVMSGNGYHLIFEIDLAPNTESKLLLANVLKAANTLCGISGVADIDRSVFNASRLIKVPGTIARKGINTPERPHRLAQIISTPSQPPLVSLEQLERLAACAQKNGTGTGDRRNKQQNQRSGTGFEEKRWSRDEFIAFLDRTGIGYRDPVPFEDGDKFVLNECPYGPHRKVTACVFWFPDGRVGFDCKESPSCDNRHWRDFAALYEPAGDARQECRTSAGLETEREKANDSDSPPRSEEKIRKEQQHNYLMKRAGSLRRTGFSVDEIEAALWAVNCSRCEAPYEISKIRAIAELAGTWKPGMENYVPADRRPVIMTTSRQLHELAEEAFRAVQKTNHPPVIFSQGQEIVHIVQTKEGRNLICPVDEANMRGLLSRAAFYLRITTTGGERGTFPPIDVVREIHSIGRQVKLDLPPLSGIVEAPTPLADGRILTKYGYDEQSGLFCIPGHIDLSDMPEKCDGEDAKYAREYLENELLADFPFDETQNTSQAHALAAILTAELRHSIPGPTPMAVVDATAPGSGKGLLMNVTSIIATGSEANMKGLAGNDEENRKAITAALATNPAQMISYDNVTGVVRSPALERALTSRIWSDRILGESRDISVSQRATWMMTGNNLYLAGDLPRRVYRIRLKPACSDPYLRTHFTHPELEAWTLENREKLLRAILTMWRAWYRAGCPKPSVTPLGSFTSWTNIVGGVLQYSGCAGFLATVTSAIDDLDTEPVDMAAFLAELKEKFPDGFTAPALVRELQNANPGSSLYRLRTLMPEVVAPYVEGKKESSVGLGKVFKFRIDRRYLLRPDENDGGEAAEFWLRTKSKKRPTVWYVESHIPQSCN